MDTVTKEGLSLLIGFYPDVEAPSAAAKKDWSNEDRMLKFIGALNRTNFIYSFDYITWMKESGVDLNDSNALDGYDLETLRKIMTAHIRLGRFTDGYIQDLLDHGYFAKFLKALKKYV